MKMIEFNADEKAEIFRLLAYNPETGFFTWNVARPGGRAPAGSRAGTMKDGGYRHIKVCGRRVTEHRLAFLFMTGSMPILDVDHLNGNTDDNRWQNLRAATVSVNMQNQRRPRAKKHGNLLGAYWHKRFGRWQACIMTDGRLSHIGYFDTEQAAHAAYVERKRLVHPGCTI